MPYISNENDRREKLRNGESALTAGELNYQIFYYVKHNFFEVSEKIAYNTIKFFVDNFLGTKPNYQKYNDMTGCLIRCFKELKRRKNIEVWLLKDIMNSYDDEIAKYEDTKIQSNGDVE